MRQFDLQSRLGPVPCNAGFRLPDHWTWDGSIIKGEDGRYHMFASRWPRRYPMHPTWLFLSQIVRASSDSLLGPYTFEEVVLDRRSSKYFDGCMTHNPSIRKHGETYLLFYIGATYMKAFPEDPKKAPSPSDPWYRETWLSKRIGLAWSRSVKGPWSRVDKPVLEPVPGSWDSGVTSNPSPWIMEDGTVYLAYKSSAEEGRNFNIGIARAEAWDKPFRRLSPRPCFRFKDADSFVEDPFLWHSNNRFHMITKDMNGSLSGSYGNGIYASSPDGIQWTLGNPATCHKKTITWDSGKLEQFNNMERLQLYFDESGQPSALVASTARATGNLEAVSDAWVNVIPIHNPDIFGE